MPNTNCLEGKRCPACGQEDAFFIEYTMRAILLTYDEGTPDLHGDLEYGDASYARCIDCGWEGTVADLDAAGAVR